MEHLNEAQAWNLLLDRFPDVDDIGYKSMRMQTRYHKKAVAAAGTIPFFNVAKGIHVNNNEKANVMGQHYGIYYGLLVGLFENNAFWTAESDFYKLLQGGEIEIKVNSKDFLTRTTIAPYVRNVFGGRLSGGDIQTYIFAEGRYDTPRISVPYRPDEFIEVIAHFDTAPANAAKIGVVLYGIEAHRADAG